MLSPGPSAALISRNSAKFGIHGSHFTIFGILTSITLFIILAVIGIATFMNLYPKAFKTLKLLGSLYIIFLGVRIFISSFSKKGSDLVGNAVKQSNSKQFLSGLATDLANPMSIIGLTSMILGFITVNDTVTTKFIYSLITFITSVMYAYTYAFAFGNPISRKFLLPRMTTFERIAGILITLRGCDFLINTIKL